MGVIQNGMNGSRNKASLRGVITNYVEKIMKGISNMEELIIGKNDLATTYPLICKEWHPSKNGSLTPQMVTADSNEFVWWICEKGHNSHISINDCLL